MVGIRGALPRRVLVFCLAALVCSASLLYWTSTVRAEQLVASWYGPGFAGLTTASGEPFNPNDYTAASKTLPFGTRLIVTYNGKSVVVRINDRGPYVAGRDLDLSQAAAEYIGLTAAGSAPVDVEYASATTPTGPYKGKAASSVPASSAPAGGGTTGGATANNGAAAPSGGTTAAPLQPAKDQYAATPPVAQAAPTPAQDQYAPPPPAPSPETLETPPPDLVKPDSTVKQMIVQHLAAPPKGFEDLPRKTAPTPPPAPAPKVAPAPKTAPASKAATVVEQTTTQPETTQAETTQVETTQAETTQPETTQVETTQAETTQAETTHVEPVKEVTSAQQKPEHGKGAPGVTILPDTGGVPLGGLIGGSLLLLSGAALIYRIRR